MMIKPSLLLSVQEGSSQKTITNHLTVNSSVIKRSVTVSIPRCPSRQTSVTQETHSYQMQNCHVQPSLHQEHFGHMLTMEASHTIVLGLVILHLDYANAIMAELPDLAIKILQ